MAKRKKQIKRPNWQTLGWYKPRGCWSKYHHGKRFYFNGDSSGKPTRVSHDAALIQWADELNGSTERANYRKAADKHAALAEVVGDPRAAERLRRQADDLRERGDDAKSPVLHPHEADPLAAVSEQGRAIMYDRMSRKPKNNAKGKTLGAVLDKFVAYNYARAKAGECEQKTADVIDWRLKPLAQFAGSHPMSEALESVVEAYALHCTANYSSDGSDYKVLAKTFIKWAWEKRFIEEMPRNIDRQFKGKQRQPNPNPLSVKQVKAYLANIDGASQTAKARCFALLALNCGLYGADIASITDDNIQGGYLRLCRAKTGVLGVWKLWDVTIKAIEEARADVEDGPIFRTAHGKPIEPSTFRHQFNRIARNAKIPNSLYAVKRQRNKTFASFRDTGETLIGAWAEQGEFVSNVESQFLAHKDSRLAAFYRGDIRKVDPTQIKTTELDKAVGMLRKVYLSKKK
jgi:hypothetical protein